VTTASLIAIPDRVALGLRVFWIAWGVALALGLYLELRQIYDYMESTKADNPFQASTILGLILAVPILLLTPKFIGSVVGAVMLVLVAKRKGWSRWILLVSLIASGAALVISVRATLGHEMSASQIWILALSGLLYLAMVAGLVQFFTTEATVWFRSRGA
jgi:hypothetical protein